MSICFGCCDVVITCLSCLCIFSSRFSNGHQFFWLMTYWTSIHKICMYKEISTYLYIYISIYVIRVQVHHLCSVDDTDRSTYVRVSSISIIHIQYMIVSVRRSDGMNKIVYRTYVSLQDSTWYFVSLRPK